MDISEEFQAGVSDYWRGWLPEQWDNAAHRAVCAYCTGWYFASLADSGILDDEEPCHA